MEGDSPRFQLGFEPFGSGSEPRISPSATASADSPHEVWVSRPLNPSVAEGRVGIPSRRAVRGRAVLRHRCSCTW